MHYIRTASCESKCCVPYGKAIRFFGVFFHNVKKWCLENETNTELKHLPFFFFFFHSVIIIDSVMINGKQKCVNNNKNCLHMHSCTHACIHTRRKNDYTVLQYGKHVKLQWADVIKLWFRI